MKQVEGSPEELYDMDGFCRKESRERKSLAKEG